jgi:protein-S-isoprenylcysteine O-methyltransferase Ste14
MTRPLPYVFPYWIVFWAVFLWCYYPESRLVRAARTNQTSSDSKSLQVIMMVQGLGYMLAFMLAGWSPFRIAPSHEVAVFYVGIATLVAGSLLRRHCWRMLGTSFTGDVRARADQEVVTRGAYRYLRHPSYTAGIMLSLGVAIALGSWLSVATILVGSTIGYINRMNVEERTLSSVIGPTYVDFMRTRKRLIPFVY